MQNEECFSKVKSRTKNIFEHASILGTLRSPSKILEAYEDIRNPGKSLQWYKIGLKLKFFEPELPNESYPSKL